MSDNDRLMPIWMPVVAGVFCGILIDGLVASIVGTIAVILLVNFVLFLESRN